MTTATLSSTDHPVRVALDAVGAAIGSARGADVWALSDDDLEAVLAECEALAARHAELALCLLREADDRDLARRAGATSTAAWLRQVLRVRPGAAKARVDLARRLRPADDEAGMDWAANLAGPAGRGAMPATAAAMSEGAVSVEHAEVIANVLHRVPDRVDDAEMAQAEAELAGWAREHDPRVLARLGEYLLHVLDADTLADDEDDDQRRRELRLNDETGAIRGRLDREGMALLRAALDALAAPQPADDGSLDPRTPARRLADALVELARQACDNGDLPSSRGARPHLTLIAEIETLLTNKSEHTNKGEHANKGTAASDAGRGGEGERADKGARGERVPAQGARTDDARPAAPEQGPAVSARRRADSTADEATGRRCGFTPGELAWGGPISAEAVRRIACDAGISRVITDPAGVPLDVGREYRIVTPGQFTALVARDGGCAFPGCTRPVSWCEAHHIIHWADGGGTCLANLVLLCGHHHRAIHHRGWAVQMGADGLPEFVPPAWVDPTQAPRRNNRPRYHRKPARPQG